MISLNWTRTLPVVFLFSVLAVIATAAILSLFSISTVRAVPLFVNLEGTALLASALSPPPPDLRDDEGRGLGRLLWYFREGRALNYPVNYNPVCFYGGVLLLAAAAVRSAISG